MPTIPIFFRPVVALAVTLAVVVLIGLGGLAVTRTAAADQTDERLDTLFEALMGAGSAEEAQVISLAILQIWTSTEDETHQAIMNEGRLAMRTNRFDVALTLFTRLTELAPEFAEAWNRRATVNFLLGNLEDSKQDVARVLELEPRHYGALGGLAQIELALDNPEAALDALETALDVFPLMPGVRERVDDLRIAVEGQRI